MDRQVVVTFNGMMEPVEVVVQEGAVGEVRALKAALESATDAAFKMASNLYTERYL
jgi:hypothetical protein